jgi:hypothetical protein
LEVNERVDVLPVKGVARARLGPWLLRSLGCSVLAVICIDLPFQLAGVFQYIDQLTVICFTVAFGLSVLWCIVFAFLIRVLRWRVLWLLFVATPVWAVLGCAFAFISHLCII